MDIVMGNIDSGCAATTLASTHGKAIARAQKPDTHLQRRCCTTAGKKAGCAHHCGADFAVPQDLSGQVPDEGFALIGRPAQPGYALAMAHGSPPGAILQEGQGSTSITCASQRRDTLIPISLGDQ